jgi:hypothetical protein
MFMRQRRHNAPHGRSLIEFNRGPQRIRIRWRPAVIDLPPDIGRNHNRVTAFIAFIAFIVATATTAAIIVNRNMEVELAHPVSASE